VYERGAWVMAQEVNRGFEVDIEGDGSKKELVRSTEHGARSTESTVRGLEAGRGLQHNQPLLAMVLVARRHQLLEQEFD